MLRHVTKILWFLLAAVSLVCGIVGLLLPVIPQVPFFLLFFYSLSKFSPRFHAWLTNTRLYQKYVNGLIEFIQKKQDEMENTTKKVWYKVLWTKLMLLSKKVKD
ncbi:DUF454 family protein [Ligilactobacillus sp. Marseille-Q7487]|uniref:DUF454 family protein n=1 Tax=Ligilactobacillus sp. Marseille-Q7487 TaxID=3022128 RepID=UPI0024A9DD08|nr:DUF454 family protein [Ligilactobacillus sp. Marseille-Q7487]